MKGRSRSGTRHLRSRSAHDGDEGRVEMNRGMRASRDLDQRAGAVKCLPILPELMMIRSKPQDGPRGVLRAIDVVRSHVRLLSGLSQKRSKIQFPELATTRSHPYTAIRDKPDRGVLRTHQVTLRVR